MQSVKINVPNPSPEQVEFYLRAWDELESYHLQEKMHWINFFSALS